MKGFKTYKKLSDYIDDRQKNKDELLKEFRDSMPQIVKDIIDGKYKKYGSK